MFVNEHVCLPLHRKSTDGPRQEAGKGEADSLREMKKPEEKDNGLLSAESIGTPLKVHHKEMIHGSVLSE